jgi:dihydrolipoamide dehydrogenase
MKKYDLVIIGGGPSGYASAMRALDFKKKILLVEKNKMGGAGITNGALSSKTWWEISREASAFRKGLHRYNIQAPPVSFKEVQAEVRQAVLSRKSMLEDHITSLHNTNYHDLLEYKIGDAKVLTPNEIEITHGAKKETVWADNIILATGSRPRYLPELPIDEKIVMTSEGIEDMEDFPESMVIVGAGVIGCEYATIFSGFGRTKVHLIDKGDRILPFEDADVVRIIERNMDNNGVLIHRSSRWNTPMVAEKYLMWKKHWSPLAAFPITKICGPIKYRSM